MGNKFQFTDDMDNEDLGLDTGSQAQAVVRDIMSPRPQQPQAMPVDDQLQEVERRMELVSYYKQVLNHQIFGANDNWAALAVSSEIQDFVRTRLGELVGVLNNKKPESCFDDDEIRALKALAAKVLQRPDVLTSDPKPVPRPEPTLVPAPMPSNPVQPQAQPIQRVSVPTPDQQPWRTQVQTPTQVQPQGRAQYTTVMHPDKNGQLQPLRRDVTPPPKPPRGAPQPLPTPDWGMMNAIATQHAQYAERINDIRMNPLSGSGSHSTFIL